MKTTVTLVLKVDFDSTVTDEEGVRDALDTLVETALSTDGVLDACGSPDVGLFQVQDLKS
jgi:hypothetical protein